MSSPQASAASPQASQQPGGDYNAIPYQSSAFPQSDPARLAGLARLFTLTPPPVETARILELGCASGGNLIPLAARHPKATVLGVDLTPRHVEEAQARIKALGLTNINIRQGDIGDIGALDLPDGGFDYIVCHGVYSWVPPNVREAILEIASAKLAPNGIAYVSYNVFPGWHMRGIVRDLMLFHAGDQGPPQDRIAKARWVLDNVAKITNAGSPYGAKLREEVEGLAKVQDSYILGEFLAADNAPCYFRDFNAAAEKHGLAFLCESDIESCLPENYGPEVANLIRTMSANQLVPLEQYIDFFMGRTFRQTLLVKKEQAPVIQRQITVERVRRLHLSGEVTLDTKESGKGKFVFRNGRGQTVTTSSEIVKRAIAAMSAAYPETRTVAQIVRGLALAGTPTDAKGVADIEGTLFNMVTAGMLKVSGLAVRVGSPKAVQPKVWPLARADAAAGKSWTTNPRHETAPLDAVTTVLAPLLDGTVGRDQLRLEVAAAVASGRLTITDDKTKRPMTGAALDTAIAEHVELGLQRLAANALLEADGPSEAALGEA
jgi:SAM-dependent methyltransferase/methyltransferase-like protein